MSLSPRVGRTLYRSLLRTCETIESELSRCGALRIRELETLKRATGVALPRDLRGLLDVKARTATDDLRTWMCVAARRVVDAALSPKLHNADGAAGFAALRHMNKRLEALRRLVAHTNSHASTNGVHVAATSSYEGFDRARFHFRYTITIDNQSTNAIQLLSRSWTIADLDGRVSHVTGPGVVGAFPLIKPQHVYQYESTCPLQTPLGTQNGHFIFHAAAAMKPPVSDLLLENEAQLAADARMIKVDVSPFALRTPALDQHYQPNAAAKPLGRTQQRSSRRRGRRRSDEGVRRR